MREVAIPSFSPIAVHTPNACHSMKCFNLYISAIYKIVAEVCKHFALNLCFVVNSQQFKTKHLYVPGSIAKMMPLLRRTLVRLDQYSATGFELIAVS